VTKIIPSANGNLVTPKVGAQHELLFDKATLCPWGRIAVVVVVVVVVVVAQL